MQNLPVIEAENVWLAFGSDPPVLEDISFTVPEGSVTAIIGPNGSGKTTLLKVLTGLLSPQKGRVRVLGKTPQEARGEVAYVPQRFSFDKSFPITVLEFLRLSHPQFSREAIAHHLEHLGIAETLTMKLGTVSGGQLQRVLVSRSVLGHPKVLFMDEPAAGIDITGAQTFYELVSHLRRKHEATVVMVSHELDVVAKYADLVLCLNRKLVSQGKPLQVLTPETMQALFGQEAALYQRNR